MGPEESMQIQSNLGSTIAMAFDECPTSRGRQRLCAEICRPYDTLAGNAVRQRWHRLNSLEDTINKNQLLFGINQGAIYEDIRIEHAKRDRGDGSGRLCSWRTGSR